MQTDINLLIGQLEKYLPYQLQRKLWPDYLQDFQELNGIWINDCGCGYGFTSYPIELAHTHNDIGWMCVRKVSYIDCKLLMLHEVAHILTKSDHNKKWRRKVLQLGGTLDEFQVSGSQWTRSYHKVIKRNDRLERVFRRDLRNSNQG